MPQHNTFSQEQQADPTLKSCFEKVSGIQLTPEIPERFHIKQGLLYRETLVNPLKGGEDIRKQLVVPVKYRQMILERGHSDTFAAHLGINKTKQRITQNFYWPEIGKQIKSFCQSNNQDRTRAKLCPLPVISTPFRCIGVDIIGPLPRVTKRGNRFCLLYTSPSPRD